MKRRKNTSNSNEEKEVILEQNAAKTLVGMKNFYEKRERDNRVSRTVGMLLSGIQLCMSVSFVFSLIALGMLPTKYMTAVIGVLAIFVLAIFIGQFLSKKNAITGKVISVLLSIILLIGTIFILKTNNTVEEVSGGDTKKDRIVVAVLADDPAQTIQDAKDYNFGVQYKLKTEQITTAVGEITNELGKEIQTTECESLQDQAEKLYSGEIDAMIFNEAYTSIIEEEFEDFSEDIKNIYQHEITTKLVLNSAAAQEVLEQSFTVYISGIDVYGEIETN
ncbi:MAG: LytR family transcriptional regulator, partial [Ruminococcus sp.]|nr:LytR family transcriptional regulator [Ruminococcus sp.]